MRANSALDDVFLVGASSAASSRCSRCSRAGTLNFLSALPRSSTSALKWLDVTPMPAGADFMSRPT